MPDEKRVLNTFESCGAVLRGHFVYTSGRHGPVYVNKDALYMHPVEVGYLCDDIAYHFSGGEIEVVAAPAVGGVILAQWIAYGLSGLWRSGPLAVYAEPDGAGGFAFRRGYDRALAGRRVLVVDDILTTGGSLRKVIAAVTAAGGTIAGAAAIVNRGRVTPEDVGSPAGLVTLATLDLESYAPEECPLCHLGVPIDTAVGKGAEFLAARGN